MLGRRWMQRAAWMLCVGAALGCSGSLLGQSQQKPADSQDNPFPAAPAAQQPAAKPKADAPKPGGDGDNPFPGESSDAPIIPVDPQPGQGGDARQPVPAEDGGKAGADPDSDPVKSPDGAGAPADDGFSSSRQGLRPAAAADEPDPRTGKQVKKKTLEQLVQENVDIGSFYLDRKNWKAAQGRFQDALTLNAESAEAVWGLAEAERHLNLYADALKHYQLFLSYDPDGPHGKAARKAAVEMEGAVASVSHSTHTADSTGVQPR